MTTKLCTLLLERAIRDRAIRQFHEKADKSRRTWERLAAMPFEQRMTYVRMGVEEEPKPRSAKIRADRGFSFFHEDVRRSVERFNRRQARRMK